MNLTPRLLINLVTFQAVWFACVFAAGAHGLHALAILAAVLLTAHNLSGELRWEDLQLGLAAAIGGTLIDALWVSFGVLSYEQYAGAPAYFAPYWISLLWFGVGLSIHHSMAWFRDNGLLGAGIVGLFGPVTYLSGERLGAIVIENYYALLFMPPLWFGFFRLLSLYSERQLAAREAIGEATRPNTAVPE